MTSIPLGVPRRALLPRPSPPGRAPEKLRQVEAQTAEGTVEGVVSADRQVRTFKAIPLAAAPVGQAGDLVHQPVVARPGVGRRGRSRTAGARAAFLARLPRQPPSLSPGARRAGQVQFDPRKAGRILTPMIALIILIALLAAIVIAGLWAMGIYNSLVALRNQFKNAFAQIDVQLKRRYDLIPNLVETAKGYMKHEHDTLEDVIKARNVAYAASQAAATNPADGSAVKGLAAADAGLTGALSRLMVVSEQYPDLKANQNMLQLTEELTSTENKVAFARQAYNDSVMTYNTARETFPNVALAGMFGFLPAELFHVDDPAERNAPKVSFS